LGRGTQHAENLLELNTLIGFPRGIVLQPVVQRILDVGATSKSDISVGLRAKVNF
jgi:carbohydrate-selective porin OprB